MNYSVHQFVHVYIVHISYTHTRTLTPTITLIDDIDFGNNASVNVHGDNIKNKGEKDIQANKFFKNYRISTVNVLIRNTFLVCRFNYIPQIMIFNPNKNHKNLFN